MLSLQEEKTYELGLQGKEIWQKRYNKAEKAIDRDEDGVVLCLLIMENKKEKVNWFTEDVNSPLRLV